MTLPDKPKTRAPRPKPAGQSPAEVVSIPLRIAFGKRLREERTAAGISQAQLALTAKFNRMHVSEIERGKHNITFETAAVLARAVGFDVDVVWQTATKPSPTRSKK